MKPPGCAVQICLPGNLNDEDKNDSLMMYGELVKRIITG